VGAVGGATRQIPRYLGAALAVILVTGAPSALAQDPAEVADASVQTVLVSRVGLDGPAANGQSFQPPSISRDGRYIVFFSDSTNLTADDPEGPNVFRKDTVTGETVLVSVGTDGRPLPGLYARMSGNGQQVCFLGGPGSAFADQSLFARNIATGTTREIPGTAIDVEHGHNDVDFTGHACAISDDGETVVYNTVDSHDAADTNGLPDIYGYSFATGRWALASRADGAGGEVGNGYSRNPTMTPDGRFVVFWSKASNLAPGDTNNFADVYRRDMVTGTTELVNAVDGTTTTASTEFNDRNTDGVISDDGRYVAFASDAELVPGFEYLGWSQVWRRDMVDHRTTLVSRVSGPQGAMGVGFSQDPDISPDGRYVAFESFSGNLDPNAITGPDLFNIFIRDVVGARTALVSRATGVFGAPGDGFSFGPAMSSDQGRVAFASRAENFSPDDVALGDAYYRDTVGLLPDLPADLPGPPEMESAAPAPAPSRAVRGGKAASGLRFRLSEWTRKTKLRLDRCTKKGKRGCKRYQRELGIRPGVAQEGRNVVALKQKRARGSLKPGLYRLKLQGTDLGSRRGKSSVKFKIRR
jgi:Tol biopolymer transport system component